MGYIEGYIGAWDSYNRLRVATTSNLPQELLKSVEYEPGYDLVSYFFESTLSLSLSLSIYIYTKLLASRAILVVHIFRILSFLKIRSTQREHRLEQRTFIEGRHTFLSLSLSLSIYIYTPLWNVF